MAEPEGEVIPTLYRAFQDWRLLHVLPLGVERLGDLPAWVVDSFRVCAELDEVAKIRMEAEMQARLLAMSRASGG